VRPFDDENWLSARRVARELDKVLDASGSRRVAVARAAGELPLSTRRIYMLLARYRRERTVSSLRDRNGAARRKRLDALTQPLLRRLTSRARLENESKPRTRNHKSGVGAANLDSLLAAYGTRRRPARASDAWRLEFLCVIRRVFQLGVLELHLPFENLTVVFDKPQGAVEIDVRSRPPQQTFVLEPFEVGKVA
jgi:hypothetical protein